MPSDPEVQRYALVESLTRQGQTDIVVNIILWDGSTPYQPAAGSYLIPADAWRIGDQVQ